ncbi:metallopeptidase family protein [Candidatus Saccharibacteria bacterium]|nr:metallopeptidase family protein [Candidatus Saccharibacteria bacterium]
MNIPSDEFFEDLVNQGIEKIPKLFQEHLNNVAIVIADEPTPEQRRKLKLRCNQTLFGLYEGIPLTKRGAGYNMVLPDKITIFKMPIALASQNEGDLKEKVRNTVWHEIAHYYGLNHEQIHKLEQS